jgi:hypothetical protein
LIIRVAIYSAGAGGNYILDATNLLEFLPGNYAWLATFLSIRWAVGYTITGFFAWGFMANFSCAPDADLVFAKTTGVGDISISPVEH